MKRAKGFTLIEVLIVVAIILVIAAISVPNLLRAHIAANEASAVGSLRTMSSGANSYSSTYGDGFPPSLAVMGSKTPASANASCDEAQLIDNILTSGKKSGYIFNYTMANPNTLAPKGCSNPGGNSYFIEAHPQAIGQTGQRSFCTDQSGVIRFDPSGTTVTDEPSCQVLPPLQ
jgi:type IV pilus assembly protein PilA